ncbi:MAG: heavy metal translocating P-type ATPase [Phycisphaeraceae bacterium]|nr:heavy metal translocating P-type ATPase [Phycisphaeraceae bacterium]
MPQITLDVRQMHCAGCVSHVEKALLAVPGVAQASVSLATERAVVTLGSPLPKAEALLDALAKAGYPGSVAVAPGTAAAVIGDVEVKKGRVPWSISKVWGVRAIVGLSLAVPVAVLAMLFMKERWSPWTQLGLTSVLMLVIGLPIVWSALRGLFRRRLDMDTLIALGTCTAFGYSVTALATDEFKHMYFESAAVILALVAVGRWMELRVRGQAASAVRGLMELAPATALVVDARKTLREVPVAELRAGDIVVVKPGQRVPADGMCEQGTESSVDESMLTGESVPVQKHSGDMATGGTLNTTGVIKMTLTATGSATVLAQIAQTVELAQSKKGKIQKMADRVAGIFVPVVVLVAIVTACYWGLGEGSWRAGIQAAVAVLIVACPCALGLAVPMSVMVGSGIGARRGILFKDPSALENAGRIDACLLDKTGTITSGLMSMTDMRISQWFEQNSALQHVHAVTTLSDHPVSRAITLRLRELGVRARVAQGLHTLSSGKGVLAMVEGQEVYVGAPGPAIIEAAGEQYREMLAAGSTVACATIGGRYAALFAMADRTKLHTRDAIKRLQDELGLKVVMLTGDHARVAEGIAQEAGIKEFRAGVQPAGKVKMITAMQNGDKGEPKMKVAMVGDGINDAPALATADVGIAMGNGSDIAKAAGHIVLVSGDVRLIPQAIILSRAMVNSIQIGLAWAFIYNIVLIPVAAMGFLDPMLAAGAMTLSSLSVIGNALLLRRVQID